MVDMTEKSYKDLTVGDLLSQGKKIPPATVGKDAVLKEAVEAMIKDSETRKVYVLDANSKLIGTITLETLMRHAGYSLGVRKTGITSFLKMLGEISNDKVTEFMTKPIRVYEDELLVNVTKHMVEYHLNDLPVINKDNELVGELNGLDILRESKKYW